MESIVKKGLSSLLIIMMLFTIAMPAIVNASEEKFTIGDMKLNRIITFRGETFALNDYNCDGAVKKEYPEDTKALVMAIYKKEPLRFAHIFKGKARQECNSLLVFIKDAGLRMIKVDSVVSIDDKFIEINPDQTKLLVKQDDGVKMTLDIQITDLEGKKIKSSNSAVAYFNKDGYLEIGMKEGTANITIQKDGQDVIAPISIVNNGEGKIAINLTDGLHLQAGGTAQFLELVDAGAAVKLDVSNEGVVEVHAEGQANKANEEFTYAGGSVDLSYDPHAENPDIMAGGTVTLLDKSYTQEKVDTQIIKTIMDLINMIKKLKK